MKTTQQNPFHLSKQAEFNDITKKYISLHLNKKF